MRGYRHWNGEEGRGGVDEIGDECERAEEVHFIRCWRTYRNEDAIAALVFLSWSTVRRISVYE